MSRKLVSPLKWITAFAIGLCSLAVIIPTNAKADIEIARNCEYTGNSMDMCTAVSGYSIVGCKNNYGPVLLQCGYIPVE